MRAVDTCGGAPLIAGLRSTGAAIARSHAADAPLRVKAHENSRAGEAGGRQGREDSRQGRRLRRRTRQRQNVDESVLRDRRRRSASVSRKPARRPKSSRSASGRSRPARRSAPRSPWAPTAASWSRHDGPVEPLAVAKILEGGRRGRTAGACHSRQAGDRRRQQPDRPDAGRLARLAARHVRLEGRHRG